jgi:hypothetical protein
VCVCVCACVCVCVCVCVPGRISPIGIPVCKEGEKKEVDSFLVVGHLSPAVVVVLWSSSLVRKGVLVVKRRGRSSDKQISSQIYFENRHERIVSSSPRGK